MWYTPWMDLEIIILREVRQRQISHDTTHLCLESTKDINEHI